MAKDDLITRARAFLHENPKLSIAALGGLIAISWVIILWWSVGGGPAQGPRQVYYYDLSSQRLFGAVPQEPAPNDMVVRAFVFACESCQDGSDRKIHYLGMSDPDADPDADLFDAAVWLEATLDELPPDPQSERRQERERAAERERAQDDLAAPLMVIRDGRLMSAEEAAAYDAAAGRAPARDLAAAEGLGDEDAPPGAGLDERQAQAEPKPDIEQVYVTHGGLDWFHSGSRQARRIREHAAARCEGRQPIACYP